LSELVLDASAAIRLTLGHPDIPAKVFDSLKSADRVLAPRLFFSEVGNALWKYVRARGISEAEALERVREARALVSSPVDDAQLIEEALAAAVRFDHPVYDALYAVLARRRSCAVVTMDRRLESLLTAMRIDSV
jgi:predicted nucleic acid-binding protein